MYRPLTPTPRGGEGETATGTVRLSTGISIKPNNLNCPNTNKRTAMGLKLKPQDDYLRDPGPEPSWNESRYVDFYDPVARVGGWFRTGNRVNMGFAEMSACIYLPDGRVAFQ